MAGSGHGAENLADHSTAFWTLRCPPGGPFPLYLYQLKIKAMGGTRVGGGTLTAWSHPEVAKRFSAWGEPFTDTSDPGAAAGAHDTPVAPTGWAFSICTCIRGRHAMQQGLIGLATNRREIEDLDKVAAIM